ncbi:MAG TPA: thioesterase, partial [Bacteroidales bacterium]|nr:thioesterase [Bacteroidales bacterium]
ATSSWLFINRATRLPDRNAVKQLSLPYCHQRILGRDPKRLSEKSGYEAMARYYPRFSDFDFHAHVNNSVYVGWIFDSYNACFHEQHSPLRIQLDFIHELTSGDEISIGMYRQGLTHYFDGRISETEILCFRGLVEWTPI